MTKFYCLIAATAMFMPFAMTMLGQAAQMV
jgi:hypothetical protein